jgi:hypothetical protein
MMTCPQDRDVVSTMSQPESRDLFTVEEILYHPLLFLKTCGMYGHIGEKLRITRAVVGKLVFNVILLLAYLCIVIRLLVSFRDNGNLSGQFISRVVIAAMYLSNFLLFPFFIVSTVKKLPNILLRFSKFQSQYGFASDARNLRNSVKGIFFVFVISVFIVGLGIIVLTSARVFDESGLLISRLLPFSYKDGYVFDVVSVTEIVVSLYWSLFHDMELLIAFLLSHIIIEEFRAVTKKVEATREKGLISPLELQRIRNQHHEVTELLQNANCIIELNVMLAYMTLLPGTCFAVYGVVYNTLAIFDIILLVVILLTQLLSMVFLTSFGVKLHSQVKINHKG